MSDVYEYVPCDVCGEHIHFDDYMRHLQIYHYYEDDTQELNESQTDENNNEINNTHEVDENNNAINNENDVDQNNNEDTDTGYDNENTTHTYPSNQRINDLLSSFYNSYNSQLDANNIDGLNDIQQNASILLNALQNISGLTEGTLPINPQSNTSNDNNESNENEDNDNDDNDNNEDNDDNNDMTDGENINENNIQNYNGNFLLNQPRRRLFRTYTQFYYPNSQNITNNLFQSILNLNNGSSGTENSNDPYQNLLNLAERMGKVNVGIKDIKAVLTEIKLDEKIECPICKDDIEDKACKTLCNHVFCNDCIKKWFETNNKCPICNKDLNEMAPDKNVVI